MSTLYLGVFNVTDSSTYPYALVPNAIGSAAQNTQNLQNWVYLLLGLDPTYPSPTGGQGGTLQFPVHKGTYYFAGTVYVCAPTSTSTIVPASIIFMGTGQASKDAPVLQQTSDADLFWVDNAAGSDKSVGGVTFQDLSIAFSNPSIQHPKASAIRVAPPPGAAAEIAALNVRIFRVHFQDCPAAVTLQNAGRTHILETSIISTGGNPNTVYGLVVGDPIGSGAAIETYIADCYLQTDTTNTGQTGVLVNNSEHLRMMNTRIEAFQYGLVLSPSLTAFRSHFENVAIREYVGGSPEGTPNGGGLVIRPPSGGTVQETAFVNCEFGPSSTTTPTDYSQAGVTIDTSGGTVDVLRFISCTSIGWHGPGLQIISGAASKCAHVEVLGGEYSGNGQPIGGAAVNKLGIMIGGASIPANSITSVRISGISCLGSVLGIPNNQNYGINVGDGANDVVISDCDLTGNVQGAASVGSGSQTATNVFIRGCNVTGYSGSAFQFNSPGAGLAITDCAGYNDQGTPLDPGALPAGSVVISSASLKYYGPVVFYVKQNNVVSEIDINSTKTGLTWGTFTLPPGGSTTAKIIYSSAPTLAVIGM